MTFRLFFALACAGLAVSACASEPYRGPDRDYYYSGSYEYGRHVSP